MTSPTPLRRVDPATYDCPVPAHVPPDLIVDFRFATGDVPSDALDPYLATDRLREPDVPRVLYYPWSLIGRGSGAWAVSHYDDIREVYESDDFSTEGNAAFQAMVGETWPVIPLGVDAPLHTMYRRFLNPHFTPVAMTAMEPYIRSVVVEMIDAVAAKGEVDMAYDFGRVYPVRIFLNLMGFPFEMFEQFLEWEWEILHSRDHARMAAAVAAIIAWLRAFIDKMEASPQDNLTSKIVNGEIDSRPLTEDEKIGTIFFLWLGGLDTVASTISQMFRHLAMDQALQARLRANPDLIPTAIEEFLRVQPLVNSQRLLKRDKVMHGVQMKKGDWVMCLNSVGNFDPAMFKCPREFDPERKANRHFTFVGGIHICLGAHLARRELRVLLAEFFARIPTFKPRPGADLHVNPGLLSIRNLPLVWDASEVAV